MKKKDPNRTSLVITGIIVVLALGALWTLYQEKKLDFLFAGIAQIKKEGEEDSVITVEGELPKEVELFQKEKELEELTRDIEKIRGEAEKTREEAEKIKAEAQYLKAQQQLNEQLKAQSKAQREAQEAEQWKAYTEKIIPQEIANILALDELKRKIVPQMNDFQLWLAQVELIWQRSDQYYQDLLSPAIEDSRTYFQSLEELIGCIDELIGIRKSIIEAINNKDEYTLTILIQKGEEKYEEFGSLYSNTRELVAKARAAKEKVEGILASYLRG